MVGCWGLVVEGERGLGLWVIEGGGVGFAVGGVWWGVRWWRRGCGNECWRIGVISSEGLGIVNGVGLGVGVVESWRLRMVGGGVGGSLTRQRE